MKLRQLNPEEIRVRAQANKGGVKLSLWKVPRANLDIIDEAVNIENRSVSYSDNGKRCTISIRINGEWLSNDGYAYPGSPDNDPNDALNHAGLAWGIGKELFHTPELFIFKDKLKAHSYVEGGEAVCHDEFKVRNISYENGAVTSVTIAICQYGNEYGRMVFKGTGTPSVAPALQSTATEKKQETSVQTPEAQPVADAPAPQPQSAPVAKVEVPRNDFADDEIILIGNCKGQAYGEVKETETFKSFLAWAKKSTTAYPDERKADQLRRFKMLAA